MAREDLVREGKMTQEEADEAAEEWENVRTNGFHSFVFYVLR